MNCTYSIIVPIFNCKLYLNRCIDSILNQDYDNFEVILINDGSTDGSLEICRNYAKKDSRIVIIEGCHKGVVPARRLGVETSKGEYCIFVDSDDWIAEDLLETILPFTDDRTVDIVNYNMKSVNGVDFKEWRYTLPEGVYEGEQLVLVYKKMMFDFEKSCPGIIQSLCTKLIKREILWSSIQTVDSRITMGEDAAVVYSALLIANKVIITNSYLYFYRLNPESLCHSKKDMQIFDRVFIFQKYMKSVFEKYRDYGLSDQLQAYLIHLIDKGIADFFSLKLQNFYHIPFELSELRGNIVLYGAGEVGRSYYRQLMQNENVKIVAWVDKKLKNKKICNCRIESPDIISNISFDKVLIAHINQYSAMRIRKQICEISLIADENIIWEEPKVNWWERQIEI